AITALISAGAKMLEVFDFLVKYEDVITMTITLVALMISYMAVRENVILRRAGTDPDVIAFLLPYEGASTVIRFHLRNVGRGVARDVEYRLAGGAEVGDDNIEIPRKSFRPIAVLPADQEFVAFFGMGPTLLKIEPPAEFSVTVDYKNIKGRRYSNTFNLNLGSFKGIKLIGKSPLRELVEEIKSLKGIVKDLKR
ncbi:MAG: hypothetical protein HC888_12520, partial [Candidatus Competibacteraceae bacterium]|nr:hypothetical protein [Candidatus Competibacteraceae bacterium]